MKPSVHDVLERRRKPTLFWTIVETVQNVTVAVLFGSVLIAYVAVMLITLPWQMLEWRLGHLKIERGVYVDTRTRMLFFDFGVLLRDYTRTHTGGYYSEEQAGRRLHTLLLTLAHERFPNGYSDTLENAVLLHNLVRDALQHLEQEDRAWRYLPIPSSSS